MISASRAKEIRALHRKKGRLEQRAFLVEGAKCVAELIRSDWEIRALLATESWKPPTELRCPLERIGENDMERLSVLDTPSPVLAVVGIPIEPPFPVPRGRWLALDGLQDPGNLGTILRLADWFGVDGLVLSPDCVDRYNPKVVQASMGSLFRLRVWEAPLDRVLRALPAEFWRAGAFLEGSSLYEVSLPDEGMLVIGNEGRGIRPETEALLSHRITIPRYGSAESLNAAMATAVLCAEWRRPRRG